MSSVPEPYSGEYTDRPSLGRSSGVMIPTSVSARRVV